MGQLAGSGFFAQTGVTTSLATRAENSARCLSSNDCSNFCKGMRTISSAMVIASICEFISCRRSTGSGGISAGQDLIK
jgi:hypothetical protein